MGVSSVKSIENRMVLQLPKSSIENVNTFSCLISKSVTRSLSFLVSWFTITKGKLETHGMELESVFEEPDVLGFSTIQLRKFVEGCDCFFRI
jgi:hypothetical protein